MKTFFLSTLLLTIAFFANANMDCIWTRHKAGITISYVAPCIFENQSTVDSILNIIVTQLSRRDTSLPVLVLVNHGHLSFPGGTFANFFSIGFDTLREIDDDYIFDFYWNQQTISTSKNGGLNKFKSEELPLDINSTNNHDASNAVGIKIIYKLDFHVGKPNWADIIKAVCYASQNAQIIKTEQRPDTVRYNANGWYVSLLTIDTFAINKIIDRQSALTEHLVVQEKRGFISNYWLLGALGITLLSTIVYKLRRMNQ